MDLVCGRYSLSTTAELVEEVFGAQAPEELAPRWNIAPSEPAPVVRAIEGAGRRIDLLRWGLVPERAAQGAAKARGGLVQPPAGRASGERTPSAGPLLINARAETAATLPAFRDAWRGRRCLVPADGFYEWGAGARGRAPHHIRFRDRRLFALAGLWSPHDGGGGPPLDGFTVLTCPPSDLVRPLHDRMPVILPPEAWDEWLAGSDLAALGKLLVPWEGPEMESVPVSSYVNRAGNEGPECVAPPPPPRRPAQRSLFP